MDAYFTGHRGRVVGTNGCLQRYSFRLLKRASVPLNCLTADVPRFVTYQGRALCPPAFVASYSPPTLRRRPTALRSFPVCLAQSDESIVIDVPQTGFQSAVSKPSVWNQSYRKRISKVGTDFSDYSLAAAQGAFGGLCNSHDSSVTRRDFLKSLIQGRMKNINDKNELPGLGGGDGMNGGKGTGGSGGSGNGGFGFGGLEGDDGFFIAGTGSWVLIGAAFCLMTSIFAQIFRGAGSPSHSKKGGRGVTNKGSTDSGLRAITRQGGSLSHASSRGGFREYIPPNKGTNDHPATAFFRYIGLWCKAAESAKLNFRGLFTGTLYPASQVHARAFYRGLVRLVGPKPGDWIEIVHPQDENNDESLDKAVHCKNRSLDGVFLLGDEIDEATLQKSEELHVLMDQLYHVQHLLKRSEIRRHEALAELKQSNTVNDEKEKSLRAKIKAQESMNKKIRDRLGQIHTERDQLMNVLGEAKGTLEGVLPRTEETSGQIDSLNKAVKSHRSSLRLMEKQLNVTSRERDAVLRRMEALQRDVNDIESLLEIVEKSKDLVFNSDNEDYADKVIKADSCIQVLQQYLLKPTGSRQLSPIREIGNRVVVVFEDMMVNLKRGFVQASKYIKQLEAIQTKLSQTSKDESTLSSQLTELKTQYQTLDEERVSIEKTLEAMQTTLATAQENLDGKSRQETELRGAMEQLTCEKDTLSAMMRSIQREVSDIEGLTQIMEKTRELIVDKNPREMQLDHVDLLDNCMTVLQQHHLTPTEPYDHVSRNISDRLVRVFENLLSQTKQSIMKAVESKGSLKKVEDDLESALSEESSLTLTIEGLRSQLNDMTSDKGSLSKNVQLLKNELDEKTVSLDQLRMELNNLDEVREEQNKAIETLGNELNEKKKLLELSKQTEVDMTEALQKISEERDLLHTKLQRNEEDLVGLRESLEELLAEEKKNQDQLDALQAEKGNLETQLSGLTHRIKDFESENSRLNAVAQTLRSNLDHERREKEQLEQEAEDLTVSRTDLHEKYMGEIELLKERLESAQGDCKKLEETCLTLEEAKQKLEKSLEEESNKYNERMEQLKKQYKGDVLLTGSANSDPIQPLRAETPFVQMPLGETSGQAVMNEGSPKEANTVEASSQILPPEEQAGFPKTGENKVLTWLDEADVDPYDMMPAERDINTAPPYESESSQILGNLMPNAGPICERKIHRRLSWPQDMTFALNDNLLGAAQELVEMTTATLELAAEKNELESELNEVRQAINEARAQLEERETEVSDLTEHFLQVYQIASELAADNEEQSTELRELRLTYERQKQDIESRDQRIAMLETEFAMANMAPPRSTLMKNPVSNYSTSIPVEPATSAFANSEYDDGHGRLRSISSLGFQTSEVRGLASPRFEAPGTPSMISATLDVAAPRAHSSATLTSVATRNFDDADGPSVHYSFSDMSSLSGADEDGSDAGYPDADHYP